MSELHKIQSNELGQSKEMIHDPTAKVEGSAAYQPTHEEYHISSGEYLKSAVYGGMDGVINCLAVIIGGIASGSLPIEILAIGLSVIIGDGIGMGLGDYLSAKS